MTRSFWSRDALWKALTIIVSIVALVGVALLTTQEVAARTIAPISTPSVPAASPRPTPPSQPTSTPDTAGTTPGQPPAGYSGEQSDLQIRQNGNHMEFSTDGGKTWSKEMPSDSGMSVNVQVIED
jgi:hypothetical protein